MSSFGSKEEIAKALAEVDECLHLLGYNPAESRASDGKWTAGGSGGGGSSKVKFAPSASRVRFQLARLHEDHERISQRLAQTNAEAAARYQELSDALAANPKNKKQLTKWRDQAAARQQKSYEEHTARAEQVKERARKLLEPKQKSNQNFVAQSGFANLEHIEAGANIWKRYASAAVDMPDVDIYSTDPNDTTQRSHADPEGKYVAMAQDEKRDSVFAHEMGHILEAQNPRVLQASVNFLVRRTMGEKFQSLAKLTGNENYAKDEVAKPDKFHHPYVGKEYIGADGKHYATEVLAMGIERLHENPIAFAKEDPDYFDHTLRCLRGEV